MVAPEMIDNRGDVEREDIERATLDAADVGPELPAGDIVTPTNGGLSQRRGRLIRVGDYYEPGPGAFHVFKIAQSFISGDGQSATFAVYTVPQGCALRVAGLAMAPSQHGARPYCTWVWHVNGASVPGWDLVPSTGYFDLADLTPASWMAPAGAVIECVGVNVCTSHQSVLAYVALAGWLYTESGA